MRCATRGTLAQTRTPGGMDAGLTTNPDRSCMLVSTGGIWVLRDRLEVGRIYFLPSQEQRIHRSVHLQIDRPPASRRRSQVVSKRRLIVDHCNCAPSARRSYVAVPVLRRSVCDTPRAQWLDVIPAPDTFKSVGTILHLVGWLRNKTLLITREEFAGSGVATLHSRAEDQRKAVARCRVGRRSPRTWRAPLSAPRRTACHPWRKCRRGPPVPTAAAAARAAEATASSSMRSIGARATTVAFQHNEAALAGCSSVH